MSKNKKRDDVLANLPHAMVAAISPSKGNEDLILHRGQIEILQAKATFRATGVLRLRWLPTPAIVFALDASAMELGLGPERIEISIPGSQGRWPAFFTRWGTDNAMGVFEGPIRRTLSESQNPSLDHAIFYFPNVRALGGDPIRRGDSVTKGRQTCLSDEWELNIDPTPSCKTITEELDGFGGFGVTHVGRLARRDGKSFRTKHLRDVLPKIHRFVSFACGRRTGPTLVRARDQDGKLVWEQWATWGESPWQYSESWVPHFDGFGSAFPGFMKATGSERGMQSLGVAIHWYTEANQQAGGVDGAIIHLQAVLELLSWHVLVATSGILDESGFEKLTAYSKIRALLGKEATQNRHFGGRMEDRTVVRRTGASLAHGL